MEDTSFPNRSRLRSIGRRMLFPPVEAGWSLVFKAVGLIWRPRLRLIRPSGYDRVLVIAPHPDDETIACGGTIALHAGMGDDVCVCIVTDGGRSRCAGLSREEVCRRRRQEATHACGLLGNIELIQLGLHEGIWHGQDLSHALESLLERCNPTVIYSPSGIDFHPEHIRVAGVLARVLERHNFTTQVRVRVYEVQVPLTPLLANAATDISPSRDRKARALAAYRTQRQGLVWLSRLEHYRQEIYRLPGPNEVFLELSVASFAALMQTVQAVQVRYFGIRPRPFSDGAAWLLGTKQRVRLMRRLSEH